MVSTQAGPDRRRALAIGAAIGLVAALLASGLGLTPFVANVELMTYDWRMRLTARPDGPSEDILLVSIDDDSVARMAPLVGRWPWPRLVHAALVDFLARAPAKVIVYDVLFTEPDVRRFDVGEQEWTGKASDDALAAAVARAGNVVLAADAAAEELIDPTRALPSNDDGRPRRDPGEAGDCVTERPVVVRPIAALDASARLLGHTLFIRDPDGPLRRHIPFVRAGGLVVPSLPMAAVRLARGGTGPGSTASACPPLFPYRGPTIDAFNRVSFTGYSFYDLFYSEEQILAGETPQVSPERFKDKIVVISASASGTYDVQATPFRGGGITGGEIHANVIDGLLRERTIARTGPATVIGATLAGGGAIGILGGVLGAWLLAVVSAIAAGGLVAASVPLFAAGVWLPLMPPLLAIGFAFAGQLGWQYFVEGREKRQVKRLFSRYVPRDVYEQLLQDPARAALGGSRRTMTVLFSDMRGFTTLSEQLSPEEVVAQLNEYFSRMVDVLLAHHGTLDKFVGDMVMGLFGAPVDDPDHAEHAVQAALAMTRALDALNQSWVVAGRPRLDIGIGISTGDMVAGNIGSSAIMSYTVIGDSVNLGARLESLNKQYGTRIIISDATRAALRGRYDIRPLGEVTVKGKSQAVAIYEVRST